jgi:poly(A) polymerase Pap1
MLQNKMAKLVHTGSYLIGAMTVHSDVDTICMFPKGTTFDKFFGEAECKIIGPERERTCADKSMHCALCLVRNAQFLARYQEIMDY